MSHPAHVIDDSEQALLELRVLDGEQRGAQAQVPRRRFEIGGLQAGSRAEVQLRDPLIGDARVRVEPQHDAARLEVLAGEVELDGRALSAGAAAPWRFYQPLRIGGTALALGDVDSPQWQSPLDAEPSTATPSPATMAAAATPGAHGSASPAPPVPAHGAADPTALAAAKAPAARPARRLERTLAIGGGAAAAAALALLLFTHLLATPQPPGPGAQQLATRLLAGTPEFQSLRVEAGPAGPVIRGQLDDQAQRERLQQQLAHAGLGNVALDVATGEQLAAEVTEVFRVQGIRANAQPDGPGRVTVHTHEADRALLDRAVATAQRDVPGLNSVAVQNAPPPPAPQNVPVVDDPGKRVASIVPGDTPYVVTADGTRYFAGALLPTGHRIEAIEPHRVLLVREGQRSELDF